MKLPDTMTYADLLAEGYGWSEMGHQVTSATEAELATKTTLAVIPLPHIHDGVTFTAWDKADSLPTYGGYSYYLTCDVTLDGTWATSQSMVICLNGHTITSTSESGPTICIGTGTLVELYDCADTGRVTRSANGAVIETQNGSLYLFGGTVTGGTIGVKVAQGQGNSCHLCDGSSVTGNDLGVWVQKDGVLFMEGGAIRGNQQGVRMDPSSAAHVQGDVVVTGNAKGNLVLENSSAQVMLRDALGTNADIGLGVSDWTTVTAESPFPAALGFDTEHAPYTVTADDMKHLSSDNDQYQLELKENTVYLAPKPTATPTPSTTPSATPSTTPSATPSTTPSTAPSTTPSATPSTTPSATLSTTPSATPSTTPSATPSTTPSATPSITPSAQPSVTPSAAPTPDQGQTKGEVEVKPGTPAVSVDKELLKDLAGTAAEGQTVTVTLTVEQLAAPAAAEKAELEGLMVGKKNDVLYLDLSLVKQVGGETPTSITDTGDKVLEIKIPYDFTGKRDVTVYRKHGSDPAQALTQADTKAEGTYRLDVAGGAIYLYAGKFSTYAIAYTAVENLVNDPAPALYLGATAPVPCDGSTVTLPGGGTAVFKLLGEGADGGKLYGLTLENANITGYIRVQLGGGTTPLVYGAGVYFRGETKDTLVVTLKGENTIAVTGADPDDRIAALAVPGSAVMLVGDGSLTAKATAAAGKEGYGLSGKDLTIYAPLTAEGSTNAAIYTGSATLSNTLDVSPAGARPVTERLGESGRTSTTLELDGKPLARAVFAKRETPLAPLYLDGVAIQADGKSVDVGGGSATLTREGTDYVLTLSKAKLTKSVKMNGSYAGLFFLGDTTQGLFPTASLTLRLKDDVVIDVSDDPAQMGLDLGGFPVDGFDGICTAVVAAGGQFHVTVEGPGRLSVRAAATKAETPAYGVNVTDLTLNAAADITAPGGAVYVTGDLTLGSGYAVTQPKDYTLSPTGGYGKAMMDGDSPATQVTVEKQASTSTRRPSSGRTPVREEPLPFTDVAATDASYAAVKYVFTSKLMLGTSDTTFEPHGTLTRAMLAAILYRAAGSPKVEGAPEFSDTKADAWYSSAIAWAAQTRVLRGYGNGKFGPEDPVSKEMMDLVTARQAGKDPAWVGDSALAAPATRADLAQLLYQQSQK